MKSRFIGFYKDTLIDKRIIVNNAKIVVDTNVLLDIYRYSDETANQILSMLDNIKSQLWLPYQVAYEYHKDRNNKVLGNNIRTYSNIIKAIKETKLELSDNRKHPFLNITDIKKIDNYINKILNLLEKGKENCTQLIKEDRFKNKIAELYDNRLGEDYSQAEKDKYIEEAKARYRKQIPPGYKDITKTENECGDYLIWRQMIDISKKNSCPVVFVSNDVKEDWVEEVAGIKIGPRPELIDEFYKETGQYFYCYSLNQFIKYIDNNTVSKESIKEIETIIEEHQIKNNPELGIAEPNSSSVEQYEGGTSQQDCSEI